VHSFENDVQKVPLPVSIDVFAADEQEDHPIEVARWAELT